MRTGFYSNEEIKQMTQTGFSEDFTEFLEESTDYIRGIIYTWGPERLDEQNLDGSTMGNSAPICPPSETTNREEYVWDGSNWRDKLSTIDATAEDIDSSETIGIDETTDSINENEGNNPESISDITTEGNDVEIQIDEADQESVTLTLMSLMQTEQVICKDSNDPRIADKSVKVADNENLNPDQTEEVNSTITPSAHYSDLVFDGRIDLDELFFTPISIGERECPYDSSSLKEIQVVLHGKRRVGRYLLCCDKCKRLYVNQDEVVELIDKMNDNNIDYTIE